MQVRSLIRLLVLSAVLGTAVLNGCSNLPTAPTQLADVATTASTASSSSSAAAVPATSSTTTRVINGLLGGVVTAGRFSVVIPPLAVSGTATVTVRVPDQTQLRCDLSITPDTKNRFLVPVLLVANCLGTGIDVSASTIAWYDPSTGKWVPVPGCTVNLGLVNLSAPLSHFSTYRVQGKAGW